MENRSCQTKLMSFFLFFVFFFFSFFFKNWVYKFPC